MTDARMHPNVVLISGNDEPTMVVTARQVVREVAGEKPDAFALDIARERDGQSPLDLLNQVISSVLSPPFLGGGRKTVWLQGFNDFDAEGGASAKTAEAAAFRRLAEIIAGGLFADVSLVLSGPGIDERKALFRACQEKGEVIICRKPDLRDRNWQAVMAGLVRARAADRKIRLAGEVVDYLVEALGTDTGRIDGELEKLICYCGGLDQEVTLAAAQEMCRGDGEAVSWALRDAVGERDLAECLRLVEVLLRRERDPDGAVLGLVGQVATQLRHLTQVRVFVQAYRLRSAGEVPSRVERLGDEERATCLERGLEFVTVHRYRVQQLARQCVKYTGSELVRGVVAARDTYWRCVSSSVGKRVLLEELLMRVTARSSGGAAARG